jgi:beta-fructofuranosidase
MNDPNGLIHINGEYHMFYQYNPCGAVGPAQARISWGHARSRDLVRWEHLPPALAPGATYDNSGVWSGCTVPDDAGVPNIFYTGVGRPPLLAQTQCRATSRDMIHWRRTRPNPVIKMPPAGVSRWLFRDPYVWRHSPGQWLMAVGASLWGRGAVLLYESQNLHDWKYLHPLHMADNALTHGWMWECPVVVRFGDRWLIVVSVVGGRAVWFTGGLSDKLRFEQERSGVLDPGNCFFAPQMFVDETGRCILFAWLRENRRRAARHGWQGCMSLPRIITLDAQGWPQYAPAPELETLRREHTHYENIEIDPAAPHALPHAHGDCLEIHALMRPGAAARCGLHVRSAPDRSEQTSIYYDTAKQQLIVDRARSSRAPHAQRAPQSAPLALSPGEPLDLRVFLDRSALEIFANARACLTTRIYPASPDSRHTALFAAGGPANALSFDAWRLAI